MNEVSAYNGGLTVPASMRHSEITIPGVELHHFITDDQLTELSSMRAEPVMEVCLASIGIFLGSIVPTFEQLARFNDVDDPMGMLGLFTALLTFGSLVAAIITGMLWYSRHKRYLGLAAIIRSRPKVPVKIAQDEAPVEAGVVSDTVSWSK